MTINDGLWASDMNSCLDHLINSDNDATLTFTDFNIFSIPVCNLIAIKKVSNIFLKITHF